MWPAPTGAVPMRTLWTVTTVPMFGRARTPCAEGPLRLQAAIPTSDIGHAAALRRPKGPHPRQSSTPPRPLRSRATPQAWMESGRSRVSSGPSHPDLTLVAGVAPVSEPLASGHAHPDARQGSSHLAPEARRRRLMSARLAVAQRTPCLHRTRPRFPRGSLGGLACSDACVRIARR
jgi:hypothetical protein